MPELGSHTSLVWVGSLLAVLAVRFVGSHRDFGMVGAVGCGPVAGWDDTVVHLLTRRLQGLGYRSRPKEVTSLV